jgi:hypothetical protein
MSRRQRLSRRRPLAGCLLALVAGGFAPALPAQELACDPDTVVLQGAEILVSPGGQATADLQCALNEATRLGVQKVKLGQGTFTLDAPVSARDFQGQVEGTTRASTIVEARGQGAFRFEVGAPSVKFMTIRLTNPSGAVAIEFTSDASNCSRRTIFAEVDRVDFEATQGNSARTAGVIAVAADGCGDSDQRLLGKLTVNRSAFAALWDGVATAMTGNAVVTVSFNDFQTLNFCYLGRDSSQDTSIIGNNCEFGSHGTAVEQSSASAPASTRMRVVNNRFTYRGSQPPGFSGTPVCMAWVGNQVSTVVGSAEENSCSTGPSRFEMVGAFAAGTARLRLSGNAFGGDYERAVWLAQASDTVLDANQFSNSFSTADVLVEVSSARTIIGPQQTAQVLNNSNSTYILN